MSKLVATLLVGSMLSGCAFSKSVFIKSTPDKVLVAIGGADRGETPLQTSIGCSTFGPAQILLRKEGYRDMSTTLEYKWSGRNIFWSVLLFWPGVFVVGKCPQEQYQFTLTSIKAALKGKATVTVVSLPQEFQLYLEGQKIVPNITMVLTPGWHPLSMQQTNGLVELGQIHVKTDTDYWTAVNIERKK